MAASSLIMAVTVYQGSGGVETILLADRAMLPASAFRSKPVYSVGLSYVSCRFGFRDISYHEDSVKILYFGLARERAGVSSEEIRFDTTVTVGLLWQRLVELHPGLAECRSISRVAADMDYVGDTDTITDAAEIAIIPPVAGG